MARYKMLTTLAEERGRFASAPARNRFIKLSREDAQRGLKMQSNIAVDCCLGGICDRMRAATFAEAAAHWAFTLHPELRVDDEY